MILDKTSIIGQKILNKINTQLDRIFLILSWNNIILSGIEIIIFLRNFN
jgi:hypothetical protein